MRGRFIRGYHYDTGVDPDSAAYGAAVDDSFKSHSHTVNDPGHDHFISGNGYNASINAPEPDVIVDVRQPWYR